MNKSRLRRKPKQDFIALLLGVSPAQAAEPPKTDALKTTQAKTAPNGEQADQQPGALSLPPDPAALLDTRYLWSPQGWLLHTQRQGAALHTPNQGAAANNNVPPVDHTVERQTQAYNRAGQLLASVHSTGSPESAQQDTAVWRYAWQPRPQQRLLAQEVQGPNPQSQTQHGTTASRFDAQGRLASVQADQHATALTYNPNGQPEQVGTAQGPRRYNWDALGRLTQVRQGHQELARDSYNHRGLRTTKTVSGSGSANTTTHTLYNESRQPLAELNAQGRITRQYIWLVDMLLAVMDSDSGLNPASANETSDTADGQALAQEVPLSQDLWALLVSWGQVIGSTVTDQPWQLTFIHTNHLGAPELATNAQGLPVWAADYAPFGAATVRGFVHTGSRTGQSNTFVLNLRLPGQMFDAETGLHYNRQRYYDPATGQYLSPDPLGQPDGPNAYLYAAGNPLSFIDPDGLVLFAFDGTRNNRDSRTNVFWLDQAYNGNDSRDIANSDRPYYEEGPGVDSTADVALSYSLSGRINTQLQRLDNYVSAKWRSETDQNKTFTYQNPLEITLDIVGFSRGAAAARDFANRVVIRNRNGYYRQRPEVKGGCVTVIIRFMGLFDTVASTNISSLNLVIPDAVRYAAHAVAVNEHRSTFPGESIERLSDVGFGSNRIERGFIGAHSDVGGAYDCRPGSANCNETARGDLSDVALNWMWQQAVAAGVPMNELRAEQQTVSNPVLHDESRVSPWKNLQLGRTDRSFYYGAQSVPQRQAQLLGMTTTQSETYITRRAQPNDNVVGDVNMATYRQWLQSNLNLNIQ